MSDLMIFWLVITFMNVTSAVVAIRALRRSEAALQSTKATLTAIERRQSKPASLSVDKARARADADTGE